MRGSLSVATVCGAVLLASSTTQAVQQASFRSEAVAVRVDVLVTDGRKPVAGLAPSDFELRDNGVPQTLSLIQVADVPLNVVLAIDTSASTEGEGHKQLIGATRSLLEQLAPPDRVALVTFNHAVTPRAPLTTDKSRITQALALVHPEGRTAVIDAAYVALTFTLNEPGRSLALIYTDGTDVSSWLRPGDVVESARRSNAVVYAVTTADERRSSVLSEITSATGGADVRVSSPSDLRARFRQVLEEFRSRYILAYTPTGVATGGWHSLDVRVKRRGLTVRSRPGYIGLERAR